jgi:miniconductance mechanosensitive channel
MNMQFPGLDDAWAETALAIVALLILAIAVNWTAKQVLVRLLQRLLARASHPSDAEQVGKIAWRLSNVAPGLVLQYGVAAVPHLPAQAAVLIANLSAAFVILTIAIAISGALTLANMIYERGPEAASRPLKGYVQLVKLVMFLGAAILILATLMDRSPLILLSGLGAMAAVLMLVFKDTILSLVASVQMRSNDMVRLGDWIEMPQVNADGAVIDIALHTVKVQNWDKTITTVPTHRLISDSFKNWRGMSESGGRRIKRALMLDQNSIRFLETSERTDLARIAVLRDYLKDKVQEIEAWNSARPECAVDQVNARRLTNIGTFRAYVLAYLKSRPDISEDMTLLVRQLSPTEAGLPLEIYCFTTTTVWDEYEQIQGDIFDHLIATLPTFSLRLFQRPSGLDLAQLAPLSGRAPSGRESAAL